MDEYIMGAIDVLMHEEVHVKVAVKGVGKSCRGFRYKLGMTIQRSREQEGKLIGSGTE